MIELENTITSFQAAVQRKVDAIELDIRMVQETLYVIHDDSLDRTTTSVGLIETANPYALKTARTLNGEPLPVLNTVIDQMPVDVGINIEIKGAPCSDEIENCLHHYPKHDFLISSLDSKKLEPFKNSSPKIKLAPIFPKWNNEIWDIASSIGAWSIHLHFSLVSETRIETAHAKGLRIFAYTVNEYALAQSLAKMGIDGIFTDNPGNRIRQAITII